MPSSITKTLTGRVMVSPHPANLGRVGRIMTGDVTGTVFSALPNALPYPATTITLTLPTYIGNVILWLLLPDLRVNGPSTLTIGLNLFSLRAPLISPSSPPTLNIAESAPPNELYTLS